MNTLLKKVMQQRNLTTQEAESFLSDILTGNISPVQLSAILVALRMKGEAASEILGFIKAMRAKMLTIKAPADTVDVCGTGGDGADTFNISTTVAFVVAGAGVPVAKHGNRAASSKSGGADVLEALGAKIDLSPLQAEAVLANTGMVFLFAPHYHPAMKHVAPVRKELGVPTIFNLLGPFANPAGVRHQLIGVPSVAAAEKLAEVACKLPYTRLLIVSSQDGLDEISLSGSTALFQIEDNKVTKKLIRAEEFGLVSANREALRGGSAADNAIITEAILAGESGARRDIVVLNAAFALYAADAVTSPEEGFARAKESIDSGNAQRVLTAYIKETARYA